MLELTVRDPAGRPQARFALIIAGGECAVRRGAPEQANARATIASDNLIALARGRLRWPQLTSGRFELSGDPFLALRFAALFRLPVALDPVSAPR